MRKIKGIVLCWIVAIIVGIIPIKTVYALEEINLDGQIHQLYSRVGEEVNLDYLYIKMLHLMAGGNAVYADLSPDIYKDTTIEAINGPMELPGANQDYNLRAPWVENRGIEVDAKYYLPDAMYNVAYDIVNIMSSRDKIDRSNQQDYFDILGNEAKTRILFYEASLEYCGASQISVNNFYQSYMQILYNKDIGENTVEIVDGSLRVKDKYAKILSTNGASKEDLSIIATIMSFDNQLANSNSLDTLDGTYRLPYNIGETTRANLMTAAMSIVGKVSYVWGGGHLGTADIDGINPIWNDFYTSYISNNKNNMCIRPDSSWCPIHGYSTNENGCLLEADMVYSAEQYIKSRESILENIDKIGDRYKEFLTNSIIFEYGVNSHRLDGLDCSGYASWVYNQIDNNRRYDSGARYFIRDSGLKSIGYGSRMMPGDVFSWALHIVIVVGPSSKGSDAYVMLEASPNTVKFGTIYYGSATYSEREEAKNIAEEANKLLGNLEDEKTNTYNMSTLGYSDDIIEKINGRYAEIGRFTGFEDEGVVIEGYNKEFKDFTANEVIQYTIDKLGYEYISGAKNYTGSIFNISVGVENEVEKGRLDIGE